MMKLLQKKFIRITMLAVTAVMLVLCISVNAANYISTCADLNRTLDMIADNRGTIPTHTETDSQSAEDSQAAADSQSAEDSQSATDSQNAADTSKNEPSEKKPENAVGNQPPALPENSEKSENAETAEKSGSQADTSKSGSSQDTSSQGSSAQKDKSQVGGTHNEPKKHTGPFTEETPYSTRYFVLRYTGDGVLSDAGLDNIASITEDDVPEYLEFALSQGEGTGYYNGYQYKILKAGKDRQMAIFLDCYQERRAVYTLAILSFAITCVCIGLVYVIVLLSSKRAIAPMLKNAQRQKQFITDASHELKTPITVIATSLTVLEMEVGKQKWIDKAMSQTEKLKALVNSLVTLARMDEEESPLKFADFAAGTAIRETAESFVDFAESKGLSLTLDIDDEISYRGDEYAIRQLISILLDNAIKYAAEGSEISFSLKKSGIFAKGICIRTQNSCENLDTDKLDKLFDRFYRSDESREGNGFGIGLSIARSIAEGHHGKITATSPSDDVIVFTADLK